MNQMCYVAGILYQVCRRGAARSAGKYQSCSCSQGKSQVFGPGVQLQGEQSFGVGASSAAYDHVCALRGIANAS